MNKIFEFESPKSKKEKQKAAERIPKQAVKRKLGKPKFFTIVKCYLLKNAIIMSTCMAVYDAYLICFIALRS